MARQSACAVPAAASGRYTARDALRHHAMTLRPSAVAASGDLAGLTVVLTRPAGSAGALARQVRARGGHALLLPGLSLRAAADPATVREELQQALQDDVLIFNSPAAVHHAGRLCPLSSHASVLAVGQGTAQALRRQGLTQARAPQRQDSEGLLDEPALQQLAGRRVALIGAAGGRGLLRPALLTRGASVREVQVYQRLPPRLDRRHHAAVLAASTPRVMLISSAEALGHLQRQLPTPVWQALRDDVVVVSSERLREAALAAGFARVVQARSALGAAMLDAVAEVAAGLHAP
jgi:uroporphyrinogen-III synthase